MTGITNQPSSKFIALITALTLSAGLAAPAALAQNLKRERLNEALRAMLISLAQDPLFADGEDLDIVFSQQPQALINLGVVYGDTSGADVNTAGLPVVAVTPRSTAANMGLRVGDRIIALNTEDLLKRGHDDSGKSRAVIRVQQMLTDIPANDNVTVTVIRGEQQLDLEAPLQKWQLPGINMALTMPAEEDAPDELILGAPPEDERSPCGTVSLYDPPPHEFNLYPAYLTGINVDKSGAVMRGFQYLTPGEYQLMITDLIPSRELRSKHTRFASRREAKPMKLEVTDGMVYHVAAKLLYERKQQMDKDEYWQPVVWRSEPGFCKGRPVSR